MVEKIIEDSKKDSPTLAPVDKLFESFNQFLQKNNGSFVLNADLVFIPFLHSGQYFCICMNYKSKKVEVLDQKYHNDWHASEVKKIAEAVVRFLVSFFLLVL